LELGIYLESGVLEPPGDTGFFKELKCYRKRYGLCHRGEALAKKEMICPFLGQLCKNCAIYIGRHYYLCYSTNYRGYIGRRRAPNKAFIRRASSPSTKKNFKIPVIKTRVLDPFNTDL